MEGGLVQILLCNSHIIVDAGAARWSRRALNTTESDRCATGGLTKEIDKNSFLVCLIGISFLPPAGLEIMARK
jgi:hypothetical protein